MNKQGKNILDKKDQFRLSKCLSRYASCIESSGLAQSRRIEGQFVNRREIQAYEKVFFYVQQGLGNRTDILKTVLKSVVYFQKGQQVASYPFYIYIFGKHEEDFKKEVKFTCKGGNPSAITSKLSKALGDQPGDTAFIPDLSKPKRRNLVVFICNTDNITLSENALSRYNKSLKKTSLWVFAQGELAPWFFGGFEPKQENTDA